MHLHNLKNKFLYNDRYIDEFLCKLYIFTYTSYTHYIMMVIIDASENPCILKVKKGFGICRWISSSEKKLVHYIYRKKTLCMNFLYFLYIIRYAYKYILNVRK